MSIQISYNEIELLVNNSQWLIDEFLILKINNGDHVHSKSICSFIRELYYYSPHAEFLTFFEKYINNFLKVDNEGFANNFTKTITFGNNDSNNFYIRHKNTIHTFAHTYLSDTLFTKIDKN